MKTPIQIIRERKYALERELESKLTDVDGIVNVFVKETGVPVSGINIKFLEATTIGGPSECHVSGVDVEYEL